MSRFPLQKNPPEGSELAGIYREITESGFGDHIPINWFTSQGIRPDILKGTWGLIKSILVQGELPATLKQMIATVISKQNECRYCSATHTGALNALGIPQEEIDSCATDPELREITEPQRSVLHFALKAARDPNNVTNEEFQKLRDFGLSEGEILEVCIMAAFTSFINIWADISAIPLDGEN